jgi:hypothetical protein
MRNFTLALSDALMSSIQMSKVCLFVCSSTFLVNNVWHSMKTARLHTSKEGSPFRLILVYRFSNLCVLRRNKMRMFKWMSSRDQMRLFPFPGQ